MEETLESIDSGDVPVEKRVGFGPRFGAMILDGVIAGIIGYAIAAAGIGATDATATDAEGALTGLMATLGAIYVAMIIYMLIEGIKGASPGKMVLGLQIANQDGSKGDISLFMKRWAIKNVGYIFGALAVLTGVLALATVGQIGSLIIFVGMFMVFSTKKLTLHDTIAKTAVFRKEDVK